MQLRVVLIVFCVAGYVGASDPAPTESTIDTLDDEIRGDGVSLLLRKLEAIENRLQKIEDELQKHRATELTQSANIGCITPTTPPSTPIPKQPPFGSCKDAASNVSGIYQIRVESDSEPFNVSCEQQKFGGGWIVIQHRYDGSLEFYRGWNDFRDGFGDLEKEFWLGLEKVHQITQGRTHELIVELKDFNGTFAYAQYDGFEIGSENEKYVLKNLGSYRGSAGDSLSFYNGAMFTTKDQDNDLSYNNCAQDREGAWWYMACTDANLNGRYINATLKTTMYWSHFKKYQGMSFSRMMIRELE
ncbi:angiopoietin-related protein 1-like [Anopheles darlingi]|uniref:angiopoietin-related protein 1-like n=1 Tax=Anopheles darlingi TaxID=43151 RepID=UPI0021003374|nr:angiopoietin-related protein 1-like [Anopheles darlingi]